METEAKGDLLLTATNQYRHISLEVLFIQYVNKVSILLWLYQFLKHALYSVGKLA